MNPTYTPCLSEATHENESDNWFSQIKFKSITLKPAFGVEALFMSLFQKYGNDHSKKGYFSKKEQEKYTVTISTQGLFTQKDQILCGDYLFVLTEESPPNLICVRPSKLVNHSFLSQGKSVFGAGSLVCESGYLQEITNNSGHYCPTDAETLPVIKALSKASRETLRLYQSYASSAVPRNYNVSELLSTDEDNLSTISSLQNNQVVNRDHKVTTIKGYFIAPDNASNASTTRQGLPLSHQKLQKYTNWLHYNLFKFTPEEQISVQKTLMSPPI